MDRLGAMRSFVEVVDRGGFTKAGRSLGMSGPMIGNHIRFLEAQLGGLLLNRTTRAQNLTELGHAYLKRCRNVLVELEAAEAEAAELLEAPRGRLRVTAPHSIGTAVLPPVIVAFLAEHPMVEFDLHLEDRRVDLLTEGFDAAIRSGELEDATLITRALAPLQLVVCAAPNYLRQAGEPLTLTDLASHQCLDFAASATPGVWRFDTASGVVDARRTGRLRAKSGFALRAAALEGLGIIMQPKMLLLDEISSGRLVPLLREYHPQSRSLQLLTPNRQVTPKLRGFIDAVLRHLGTPRGAPTP